MFISIKPDIIFKKEKNNIMLNYLVDYYLKYSKFYKQKKPVIRLDYNLFIKDYLKKTITKKEKVKILYYLKKFKQEKILDFWSVLYFNEKKKKPERKVYYRINV